MFLMIEKPQYLQLEVWALQSSREQLHSWVTQVIVTHVQLHQGWVWCLQGQSHSFTADVIEKTW